MGGRFVIIYEMNNKYKGRLTSVLTEAPIMSFSRWLWSVSRNVVVLTLKQV